MTERDAMLAMLAELLGVSTVQVLDLVRERMASLPGLAPPVVAKRTRRQPSGFAAEWLAELNAGLARVGYPEIAGLTAREEQLLARAERVHLRAPLLSALAGWEAMARRATAEERERYGHLWRTVDHHLREANLLRYASAAVTPRSGGSRPPTEMLR
jgi:hypothetical protein